MKLEYDWNIGKVEKARAYDERSPPTMQLWPRRLRSRYNEFISRRCCNRREFYEVLTMRDTYKSPILLTCPYAARRHAKKYSIALSLCLNLWGASGQVAETERSTRPFGQRVNLS